MSELLKLRDNYLYFSDTSHLDQSDIATLIDCHCLHMHYIVCLAACTLYVLRYDNNNNNNNNIICTFFLHLSSGSQGMCPGRTSRGKCPNPISGKYWITLTVSLDARHFTNRCRRFVWARYKCDPNMTAYTCKTLKL